jgi:hypothetical protein
MIIRKPLKLPPEVGRRFVELMHAYFRRAGRDQDPGDSFRYASPDAGELSRQDPDDGYPRDVQGDAGRIPRKESGAETQDQVIRRYGLRLFRLMR